MKKAFNFKHQSGRSMIEMLAVLAIIGVVSIGGLLGYRRAVDTHKVNTIFDDVNRFEFVISERIDRLPDGEIDPLDFKPISGFKMEAYNELEKERHYIKVLDVPKNICQLILSKGEEKYVMFATNLLYEGDEAICLETNDMLFYFGETAYLCSWPLAGQNHCSNGCLCPSETHHCLRDEYNPGWPEHGLPAEYLQNPDTICCPKEMDAACDNECKDSTCPAANMQFDWSICDCNCTDPQTMVYDPQKKDCVVSNGACSYEMAAQQTQEKTANCSYTMAAQQTQTKTSNCRYTISIVETANGNVGSLTVVSGYGCPRADEYCYLAYADANCATALEANATGTLYGTCIKQNTATSQCYVTGVTGTLSPSKPCTRPGEYCYLAYADDKCTTALEANATGTLYGTCIKQNTATSQCYVTGVTGTLTPIIGCPATQYCYLKWADSDCESTLEANATGTLYGSCIAQNSNSVTSCPPSTQQ